MNQPRRKSKLMSNALQYLAVTFCLISIFAGCKSGKTSSQSRASGQAASVPAAEHAPVGDPRNLPKVAADVASISAALRDRFGEAISRKIRIEVQNRPGEGLRVSMSGEVPNEEIRVALMKEIEERVENIKSEDFNLDIAGSVPMFYSFPATLEQNGYTYFAPDLSFAVGRSGSVYEVATGRRMNRIDLEGGSHGPMLYMELSPDGKTLACCYRGGGIDLFDMPMGQNRRMLQPPGPETSFDDTVALGFSSDCKQLITINRTNGDLRVWDLAKKSAKQIGSHIQPNQPYLISDTYFIVMSPDGKTIATANSEQPNLFLWDVASRSRIDLPAMDRLIPTVLAWSHDGKTIAVGRTTGDKRGVLLYDVASKQWKILAAELDAILKGIAFSPDDKTLAVSYENQGIRLWDLTSGDVWQTLEATKTGESIGIAFSPDGAVLAVDGHVLRPPSIRLWDVSRRPGAAAVATLPKAYPQIVTQDDRLCALIARRIREGFDPRNVQTLQVEFTKDGAIRLTGKVSDAETKKAAVRDAEVTHDAEDIGDKMNKVVDELEVTGR